MITIKEIQRFINNDFDNAILSCKIKNDKLDIRLSLKENTNITYETIPCYSYDLKELRKEPAKLFNYLLDSYLNNNDVIGISYFVDNPYHYDKTCFDILTTNGILTLALSNEINIDNLFPNFVKRLEYAKQDGIINYLNKLKEYKIEHGYRKDDLNLDISKKYKTGIIVYRGSEITMTGEQSNKGHYIFNYNILNYEKNGKTIIPKYEKNFLVILMKKILEFTDSQPTFKYVMDNIEFIERFIENGYGYFDQKVLNLGHVISTYYCKSRYSKESLKIMKEILIELESYLKKEDNCIQLVLDLNKK